MKHFQSTQANSFVRTMLCTLVKGLKQQEVSLMTQNQIRYWELQEQQRTNHENEAIKWRGNEIAEVNAESQKRQAGAAEQNALTNRYKVVLDALGGATNAFKGIVSGSNIPGRILGALFGG